MNIQFTINKEQILLRADSLNYELCKIRQRKVEATGEMSEEWEAFKFFASLPQALSRVLDMKVRSSDAITLKQLLDDLKAVRAEICTVWSTDVDVKQ